MNGGSQVSTLERFRLASLARTQAEIDEAVALAELAEQHEWTAGDSFDVVGVRPYRVGAQGTLLVDEFLPLEVAAIKGISIAAATWWLRDVVNLKARHPMIWEQAVHGSIPMFRACQLAQLAAEFDLSLDEALRFDAALAPKLVGLPWRRVLNLARGLITSIAEAKVTARQNQSRADRWVRKHHTDDPLTSYLSAQVDTADAIFFDAMIDRIADILGERGDHNPKDTRRAKALGILATPARAQLMLTEAATAARTDQEPTGTVADTTVRSTDPRLLPATTIYVHVAEETLLTGVGTARIEGIGPLAATMLGFLIGNNPVRLTPVIRPYDTYAVDSYEIPQRIRRQVILRDGYDIFPYSTRSARAADLDHTTAYRPGRSQQTTAANLGPASRKPHRAKTHGGWHLTQPSPGTFHWTSPGGYRYRVDRNGTKPLGKNEPDDGHGEPDPGSSPG